MKYILLIPALALSLAIPAHAMHDHDFLTPIIPLQALNREIQQYLARFVDMLAISSFTDGEKRTFIDEGNEGVLLPVVSALRKVDDRIALIALHRMRQERRIQLNQKLWFFNPNDCNQPEELDSQNTPWDALAAQNNINTLLELE